jgi:hypothetical protein
MVAWQLNIPGLASRAALVRLLSWRSLAVSDSALDNFVVHIQSAISKMPIFSLIWLLKLVVVSGNFFLTVPLISSLDWLQFSSSPVLA